MNLDELGIAPTKFPDVTGPAPEIRELEARTKGLEAATRRLIKAAQATGGENEALRAGLRSARREVFGLVFVALGSLLLGLLAVAVAIR
jgi:hypothetical protein